MATLSYVLAACRCLALFIGVVLLLLGSGVEGRSWSPRGLVVRDRSVKILPQVRVIHVPDARFTGYEEPLDHLPLNSQEYKQASCLSIICGQGRTCKELDGAARCVCQDCSESEKLSGVVCGFDGKTYTSHCHMKNRHCETHSSYEAMVDYQGPCQNSCDKVRCSEDKYCAKTQHNQPHCISCRITCKLDDIIIGPVCASNGLTYNNLCHLTREACLLKDTNIKFLHRGNCRANATCADVECLQGQTCLVSLLTNEPVCTDCERPCIALSRHQKLCGNDAVTYDNYCALRAESCYSGVDIGKRHHGQCRIAESSTARILATAEDLVESSTQSGYDDLSLNQQLN